MKLLSLPREYSPTHENVAWMDQKFVDLRPSCVGDKFLSTIYFPWVALSIFPSSERDEIISTRSDDVEASNNNNKQQQPLDFLMRYTTRKTDPSFLISSGYAQRANGLSKRKIDRQTEDEWKKSLERFPTQEEEEERWRLTWWCVCVCLYWIEMGNSWRPRHWTTKLGIRFSDPAMMTSSARKRTSLSKRDDALMAHAQPPWPRVLHTHPSLAKQKALQRQQLEEKNTFKEETTKSNRYRPPERPRWPDPNKSPDRSRALFIL